jgi:hypothetical protein
MVSERPLDEFNRYPHGLSRLPESEDYATASAAAHEVNLALLSGDGTRNLLHSLDLFRKTFPSTGWKPEFGSCEGSNTVTNQLIDDYCAIQNGIDAGLFDAY